MAKTAAILAKLRELYEEKLRAREALPGILAQLVLSGAQDQAARAVVLWGSGELEPHQVLALCEEMAAAAGIELVLPEGMVPAPGKSP